MVLAREVLEHGHDAWIDPARAQVGDAVGVERQVVVLQDGRDGGLGAVDEPEQRDALDRRAQQHAREARARLARVERLERLAAGGEVLAPERGVGEQPLEQLLATTRHVSPSGGAES